MKSQNILLLTATITPKTGVPNLKRTDPEKRLQDYKAALSFYLNTLNKSTDGIVFAENSNSDLSSLKELVNELGLTDFVEFLQFDGLDYPAHYDRGYGEFKLLDYAMSNSRMILTTSPETTIWKITGRYIICNIDQLILNKPKNFEVYCNCRNYPKHWVDTYFMAWTPKAYETCFRDVYHRLKTNVEGIPSGIAAEELMRSWLEQKLIRDHVQLIRRFRLTPELEGIRGGDNVSYSTQNGWKFKFRSTLSRCLTWLWI